MDHVDAGPALEDQRTSFGMQITGGQVDRLRLMAVVAEEHGDRWAELRAGVAT